MYPNAGDVQAPSPSPFQQPFTPGIGFHNDGSQPRHHGRQKSARGVEIPFDAYGKHGHGQVPHDRFEKAYYQKHPELLKKETGAYHGPFAEGRAEWAMSSEDLNKIVRDTASASRGTGLGKQFVDKVLYDEILTRFQELLQPSLVHQVSKLVSRPLRNMHLVYHPLDLNLLQILFPTQMRLKLMWTHH